MECEALFQVCRRTVELSAIHLLKDLIQLAVQSCYLRIPGPIGLCCDCHLWPSIIRFTVVMSGYSAFSAQLSCRRVIRRWRCVRRLGCTAHGYRIR